MVLNVVLVDLRVIQLIGNLIECTEILCQPAGNSQQKCYQHRNSAGIHDRLWNDHNQYFLTPCELPEMNNPIVRIICEWYMTLPIRKHRFTTRAVFLRPKNSPIRRAFRKHFTNFPKVGKCMSILILLFSFFQKCRKNTKIAKNSENLGASIQAFTNFYQLLPTFTNF